MLLLMPTIVELKISHQVRNNPPIVPTNIGYLNYYQSNRIYSATCLSLDSSILWLATLFFVHMAREEYFRGDNNDIIKRAEESDG